MANDTVVDTVEDYTKMKVVELKKLLKDRGLPLSGTKDEIIERLRQANEAAEKKLLEEAGEAQAAPQAIDEELENEIMNDSNKAKVAEKRKIPEKNAAAAKKAVAGENKENDKVKEVAQADAESEPANKVIKLSAITPEQQKELRAKKFGLTEEEKKEARAKRFGITPQVKSNTTKPSLTTVKKSPPKKDDALMKKRAERFGILGNKQLTPEEIEKRKKRAERFGLNPPQPEAITPAPVEVKEK